MDSISSVLEPFKDQLLAIAVVATILQFFSGALICRKIYINGSAAGIPPTKFINSVVMYKTTLKI